MAVSNPFVLTGTCWKFNPPTGTDFMIKGGVPTTISTRFQCITAMKEYEHKSFEELRFEVYKFGKKAGANVANFTVATVEKGFFASDFTTTSAMSNTATTAFAFSNPSALFSPTTSAFTVTNVASKGSAFPSSSTTTTRKIKRAIRRIHKKSDFNSSTYLDAASEFSYGSSRPRFPMPRSFNSFGRKPLFNVMGSGNELQYTGSTFGINNPAVDTSPHTERDLGPNSSHVPLKTNQDSTTVDLLQCIICLDKQRDTAFQPCGHLIVCNNCAKNVGSTCPMCRKRIEKKIKVFIN